MGHVGRVKDWACGVAVTIGVTWVAIHPAWAQKKKPGLFDFESWKTPMGREREAAKQLAPDKLDLSADQSATEQGRPVRCASTLIATIE